MYGLQWFVFGGTDSLCGGGPGSYGERPKPLSEGQCGIAERKVIRYSVASHSRPAHIAKALWVMLNPDTVLNRRHLEYHTWSTRTCRVRRVLVTCLRQRWKGTQHVKRLKQQQLTDVALPYTGTVCEHF